ncbi:unnamed protein product [Sphagnum compactum]
MWISWMDYTRRKMVAMRVQMFEKAHIGEQFLIGVGVGAWISNGQLAQKQSSVLFDHEFASRVDVASSQRGWTCVIVEKPFDLDAQSSADLTQGLKKHVAKEQIYWWEVLTKIDHYLGKELVENLSVLRFSNLKTLMDSDGIVQAPALHVTIFKWVKVLWLTRVLTVEDVVVGQYKSHVCGSVKYLGYTKDQTVPYNSVTPTFDVAVLFINNACWDGVPFLMKASKALHTKRAKRRVQFKHVLSNLYKRSFGSDIDQVMNELVIHVQPDEAIYLQINDKFPSLVFTHLWNELESNKVAPELYPYGSRAAIGAHYLAAKYNIRWGDMRSELTTT